MTNSELIWGYLTAGGALVGLLAAYEAISGWLFEDDYVFVRPRELPLVFLFWPIIAPILVFLILFRSWRRLRRTALRGCLSYFGTIRHWGKRVHRFMYREEYEALKILGSEPKKGRP